MKKVRILLIVIFLSFVTFVILNQSSYKESVTIKIYDNKNLNFISNEISKFSNSFEIYFE